MDNVENGLPRAAAFQKRAFDFIVALLGLTAFGWLILIAAILAWWDTGQSGFFMQIRIGRLGKGFKVIKIRTMRTIKGIESTVTTDGDARITKIGRFFRKTKIDELPQFINVLLGQMSFVGPRPDVSGFADQLRGDDRLMLTIRPGITGPATIKYRNEEYLLSKQTAPEIYNRNVIWPDKVRINLDYITNWRFKTDLQYIWQTIMR